MRAIDKINQSQSLKQLCKALNDAKSIGFDFHEIDTSSLPIFSENEIRDTAEIYSYDDKNVLLYMNEWYIEPRCDVCGEASFHCEHDYN